MQNKSDDTDLQIQKTNIVIKRVTLKGDINWELGVNIDILLLINKIDNQQRPTV